MSQHAYGRSRSGLDSKKPKTRRIRAGQYEYTVQGIVYEIHEVGLSEGFPRSRWNLRRQGGDWFESSSTLRESKGWAEVDAEGSA